MKGSKSLNQHLSCKLGAYVIVHFCFLSFYEFTKNKSKGACRNIPQMRYRSDVIKPKYKFASQILNEYLCCSTKENHMLGALITSKTRLKLLIKFCVSAGNRGYLRGIAEEFDESTNSIRKELNQLTEAVFLLREQNQKKVNYNANTHHPLFAPVQKLIHSFLGIEQAIDQVMARAGDVEQVILRGDYARGIEADQMQVSVVGNNLDRSEERREAKDDK